MKDAVRLRANHLCEYCHASEQWQYVQFTVDHIVPLTKGGIDKLENLALACFHCNRQKSNKISGTDPQTGKNTPLFNPRCDVWKDHFTWSSDSLQMIGLTAIGRATINALNCNRERLLLIRASDRSVNRHPPINDPIQVL